MFSYVFFKNRCFFFWLYSTLPQLNDVTMLTCYQSICAFLSEADAATLNSLTFDELCRIFYEDPVKVDRALYSVFGMSGDEIIMQYREGAMCL